MLKFLSSLVTGAFLAAGLSIAPAAAETSPDAAPEAIAKLNGLPLACEQAVLELVLVPSCEIQTYVVSYLASADMKFEVDQLGADLLANYSELMPSAAARLDSLELAQLARNPNVKLIEMNTEVELSATQSGVYWPIDRIDQPSLPLSGTYTYPDTARGEGVRIYIVDTGINTVHSEFAGRLASGYSAIEDGRGVEDCNGHGTHVAGAAAGDITGAAKRATIVPVRVLDCSGSGTLSSVLLGLDWIAKNTAVGSPAVVNMSLGGVANATLDNAITSLINQGLAFVVASGNEAADACSYSPARVSGAITVAASSQTDAWGIFSNSGSCVDVVAPGVEVTSAWIGSTTAGAILSGTSMAAGFVSGVVAIQLSYGYQSPAALQSALAATSVTGRITGVPAGTPNLLLQNTLAFSAPGTSDGSQPAEIPAPAGEDTPVEVAPITTLPGDGDAPPPTIPATPLQPQVSVVGSVATLFWALGSDGGAQLVGQTLKVYRDNILVAPIALGPSITSYVLEGLIEGSQYIATVSATNAIGTSLDSTPSLPFTALDGVPATDAFGPDDGPFSSWTKRISSTQMKFYVKFPELNQKIQFMVQGTDGVYREIAWVRVLPSSLDLEGNYTGLTNRIYFVRTVNLRAGKNRYRILVNGVQQGTTTTYVR